MSKKIRRLLTVVFMVLFMVSGAFLVNTFLERRTARQSYLDAMQLAGVPAEITAPAADETPPPDEPDTSDVPAGSEEFPAKTPGPIKPDRTDAPGSDPSEDAPQGPELPEPIPAETVIEALSQIDLDALREVNPEIIGWITIPGTRLSYPLLQGTDNDYYLKHTWNKDWSSLGSIYMDHRNDAAFGDFNTLIYGHRIDQESMFSTLRFYESQAHYEANPSVYIATDAGVFCYDIFAAATVDAVNGHTYRLGLDTQEGQQAYIDYCRAQSVITSSVAVEPGDFILTLSTCTAAGSRSNNRWVVQAVLREDPE